MNIPLLEVIAVRDAGRVRVRLRGELDLAGAPTLRERLGRLRERGEQVRLDRQLPLDAYTR